MVKEGWAISNGKNNNIANNKQAEGGIKNWSQWEYITIIVVGIKKEINHANIIKLWLTILAPVYHKLSENANSHIRRSCSNLPVF